MTRNIRFLVSYKCFKDRSLLYNACCTHMHTIMMLMRCLAKQCNVTLRVLQIYPLKQNLDPRFHVPSVRKRQGIHFDAATNYQNQREGGGNAVIGSSLVPKWLQPLNDFATAPCRILPLCSWSLSPSHPRF